MVYLVVFRVLNGQLLVDVPIPARRAPCHGAQQQGDQHRSQGPVKRRLLAGVGGAQLLQQALLLLDFVLLALHLVGLLLHGHHVGRVDDHRAQFIFPLVGLLVEDVKGQSNGIFAAR